MNPGHQFTPHTRINSKWIKHLHVSHETMKILDGNISSKISDISRSNIFADINFLSDLSPQARETKEKINKWDFTKLKCFWHSKGNYQQNKKTTHRIGEHIP